MTQTLDAGERFSARAMSARTAATASASRFGTFAITFGIAFAALYTVFERLNWPLFTYLPRLGRVEFWMYQVRPGEGPPMFWYGWLVLAALGALGLSCLAMLVSDQWLRRATVFGCVLTALWPATFAGLKMFISWVSFDAQFLNSVWIAAVPALVGAAAVGYFAPSRWVERVWTSWLLIMPLGGLVVLGVSLQQYFLR
jgi:hypothetical protein